MYQVTKEQFYDNIGPLDVMVSAHGEFPYTTDFKLRNGTLMSWVVDDYNEDKSPEAERLISQYFMSREYYKHTNKPFPIYKKQ